MTQKELLYIMDTVNHLKHFAEHACEVKDELQNNESQSLICSLLSDSIKAYKEYTNLVCMGGCSYER